MSNLILAILPPTNKNWYAYEEYGSYFRLENGALIQCPMNTDGTRDDSPCEVDWERGISDEDRPRMLEIVKELEEKEEQFQTNTNESTAVEADIIPNEEI